MACQIAGPLTIYTRCRSLHGKKPPMKSLHLMLAALLPMLLLILTDQPAKAGNATWNLNPISGDWNTAANWTPATVPHGRSGTATFRASNNPAISLSETLSIGQILFRPGATAFSITPEAGFTLTVNGAGVTNNSGSEQTFVIPKTSTIAFGQAALAGRATYAVDGFIDFAGSSSADRSASVRHRTGGPDGSPRATSALRSAP